MNVKAKQLSPEMDDVEKEPQVNELNLTPIQPNLIKPNRSGQMGKCLLQVGIWMNRN